MPESFAFAVRAPEVFEPPDRDSAFGGLAAREAVFFCLEVGFRIGGLFRIEFQKHERMNIAQARKCHSSGPTEGDGGTTTSNIGKYS